MVDGLAGTFRNLPHSSGPSGPTFGIWCIYMAIPPGELYAYLTTYCNDLLVAGATPETLRDAINAAEDVSYSKGRVTTVTLLASLSPSEGEVLFAVLDAAAESSYFARAVVEALAGPGFDFTDPRIAGFVEQLRPNLGDALADKVLSVHITRTNVLPEPTTSDRVTTALLWHENSQRYAAARSRATDALEAGKTWGEITAAFLAQE